MTFGYARRDLEVEAREGAAWLLAAPGRRLLVTREGLPACFDEAAVSLVGPRHGRTWYLAGPDAVTGACRSPLAVTASPPPPEPGQDRD